MAGSGEVPKAGMNLIEFILEDLGLGWAILCLLLLPVFWLVSTPVILVTASFSSMPYWSRAAEMYGAVTQFWCDLLFALL